MRLWKGPGDPGEPDPQPKTLQDLAISAGAQSERWKWGSYVLFAIAFLCCALVVVFNNDAFGWWAVTSAALGLIATLVSLLYEEERRKRTKEWENTSGTYI